jgi:hypothetical protein
MMDQIRQWFIECRWLLSTYKVDMPVILNTINLFLH